MISLMVNLGTRNGLCGANVDCVEIGEALAIGDDGLLRQATEMEPVVGFSMETVGPRLNLLIEEEYDA